MGPDKEAEDRDGYRGERDCGISKDPLSAETRDYFRHDTHTRQDHDVHGWMGIKPEEMLKQQRVTTFRRIEDTDADEAFEHYKKQGYGDNRRGQDKDDGRCIVRPDEQG